MQVKTPVQLSAQKFEEVLVFFTSLIHKKSTEAEVLWDIVKHCIAKLEFVDCVIYLLNFETRHLEQVAAHGPKNPKNYELFNPVMIPLGQGITGHVAATGKALIVKDTSLDPRYIVDDERRLSEICVPIFAGDQVIGVIDCESPEKNFFTTQHLCILTAIASMTGFKLEQIRAQQTRKKEHDRLWSLQKEMGDIKIKALRSQMNPHFVFNALNAIQHFVSTGNQKLALNYLSDFSKLIRFYLKNLEKDVVYLTEEIEMLHRFLSLQKLRYEGQISYQLAIERESENRPAIIPSFVIQTLFENIIEHAIYNQYVNFSINSRFFVTLKNVQVHISFKYDDSGEKKVKYIPEYRAAIVKWQDQIRYLRKIKKIPIKKKMHFEKKENYSGGTITLTFPNLA